jgi:serine/threonine protein kinase
MPTTAAGDLGSGLPRVYGLLNKHCPHIGYFHYSPTQTRSLNLYFYENFTPIEEVERRKRIKLHPYTGNFHFAPGKYSDLHGLEKYRKSRWKSVEGTAVAQLQEEEDGESQEQQPEGKDQILENFIKKMKKSSANPRAVITEQKSSSDDSSINGAKTLSRINSTSKLTVRSHRLPSSDSIDKLVSWSSRAKGRRSEGGSGAPGAIDEKTLQQSLQKWKQSKGRARRRSVEVDDCITPPTSPVRDRDRDRRDEDEVYREWFSSPRPPLQRPTSPTNYEPIPPPPALSTSTSISSIPPGPTFIDPKSSWQVHTPDGSNSLYIQNNKTKPGGLRITSSFLTDNYELLVDKMLGEGSYAKAYLGKSLQSSGYVAIKVISKTMHSADEELRFKREIENQTRLWHHNVVTVRDVYESMNYVYIVMDYCPGGTLDGILQLRRRLDEEETRFIAYQMVCGLAYVHDNGVLHGDIKPANVMFQPQSISASGEGSSSTNRVDLLFEKRRREGKLTIALNQAPEVDYDAVKVERSGGSNGTTASQKNADLQRDAKTAVLRERLIRGKDVVSSTPLNTTGKTRRNSVTGPVEAASLSVAGGASGFAFAAERNHHRKKKRPAPATPPVPAPATTTATVTAAVALGESSDVPASTSTSCSLTAKMEQDLAFQGHIRYKCPYGLLLKICDFGLSQKVPDVKHFKITGDIYKAPYTPGGTEGYLAPEIIGHRPYGTAADMWAIGTVLYKCLAGTLPFIPSTACLEREVKFN